MLIAFAAVQYNDDDALFWAASYAAGAAWTALAALSPTMLRKTPLRAALGASVALAAVGVVAFWPNAERWWSIDVWWPELSGESSREGMGMMILALSIILSAAVAMRRA